MDANVDETALALLQDVHRKLGRFLVRIQQCEGLLKALVIDAEHAGTVDTFMPFREERVKRFANKSLGMVVDALKTSYLKEASPHRAEEVDDAPGGVSGDKPFFRLRMGIEMSSADLAHTTENLAKLVELRNRLVHHLIQDFDVWTVDGCNAALEHLDASYMTVDATYSELKRWAETSMRARTLHAEFMQSPEFLDILTYGVMPDGTVHWEGSRVVELLQMIESDVADGGWANLEGAIAKIQAQHSDHTPQRYGCKTWRQVLARSQQFDVRKDAETETAPGRTWYRSRGAS